MNEFEKLVEKKRNDAFYFQMNEMEALSSASLMKLALALYNLQAVIIKDNGRLMDKDERIKKFRVASYGGQVIRYLTEIFNQYEVPLSVVMDLAKEQMEGEDDPE